MKSFNLSTRGATNKEYYMKCISVNSYDCKTSNVDYVEIPGALSPGVIDTHITDRLKLEVKCIIEHEQVAKAFDNMKAWLYRDKIDLPIKLTSHNDYYWEGFLADIKDIDEYNGKAITFTLEFSCKAYKVYTEGAKYVDVLATNSEQTISTFRHVTVAKPIMKFIKHTGLTSFDLHYMHFDEYNRIYQDNVFNFINLDSIPDNTELILDWELMDCYYIGRDGRAVACNHLINNFFYDINSNKFSIKIEGADSVAFKIQPRWRVN